MDFEKLYNEHRRDLERFVRFRLRSVTDAEDVLQEIWLAAFRQFSSLRNEENFKAWIIGIARHKCNDYFRKKAKLSEIPIDEVFENKLCCGNHAIPENCAMEETLRKLGDKERQILYLYFWEELQQADIAARLKIPLGTVKSRLHTAKQKFKEHYPYFSNLSKGESIMKSLPKVLPDYIIRRSAEPPFAVRHEELPGMFIVPKEGEELSFGMYDQPEGTLSGTYCLKVMGAVSIHGIRGVEIVSQYISSDGQKEESTIFAQLTDSHCRYLGGMTVGNNGLRRLITFLDGVAFSDAYAIGEDNCGFEVERRRKGVITVCGNGLATSEKDDISDIVARCDVTIEGETYDTIQLVDIQSSKGSFMLCEYYLDKNGRTVLWRRFNRDDWAIERYGKRWTEMLPDNERLTVNGEVFVYWYDCITDIG